MSIIAIATTASGYSSGVPDSSNDWNSGKVPRTKVNVETSTTPKEVKAITLKRNNQKLEKTLLETDGKKLDWLKILPLVKIPQFLSSQAHIKAIVPTHGLVILTKFHKDWQKINNFLVVAKF